MSLAPKSGSVLSKTAIFPKKKGRKRDKPTFATTKKKKDVKKNVVIEQVPN